MLFFITNIIFVLSNRYGPIYQVAQKLRHKSIVGSQKAHVSSKHFLQHQSEHQPARSIGGHCT